MVGETEASYFTDVVENGSTFYYWIRHISVTDTPSNFSNRVSATTPVSADVLKAELLGQRWSDFEENEGE